MQCAIADVVCTRDHDATATFNRRGIDGENISADEIHRVHLSSLDGEFCRVLTTDEVLGQSGG